MRMRRRMSVVLPDPISPVNKQNAACDSIAYSSIVSAAECCCEAYRNAGSGFIANGFELNLKWRRYMAPLAVGGCHVCSPVEYRADNRSLVQQLHATQQVL